MLPREISYDQSQNFVGKVMKSLYKLTEIKQLKTIPYHPDIDYRDIDYQRDLTIYC